MSADIIQIRDRLPIFGPPLANEEPATVIILPVVRVERAPDGDRRSRRSRLNDCLPSDSEP
ncbi:MAG TPA: hypothetical protein VIU44_16970 [Gaiellaceae bacterium]